MDTPTPYIHSSPYPPVPIPEAPLDSFPEAHIESKDGESRSMYMFNENHAAVCCVRMCIYVCGEQGRQEQHILHVEQGRRERF